MNINYFLQDLREKFGNVKIELNYSNPFQLLIAVILSSQTTDKQVNKITNRLFLEVQTPQDILDIGEIKLKNYIKNLGLYNSKAKNIFNLSKILLTYKPKNSQQKDFYDNNGYVLSNSLEELIKLPGVGNKTAKIVLNVVFGYKYIPVDTHIHRVVNRLNFVNTTTTDQTSEKLEQIVQEKWKPYAHLLLIYFGRYYCKSKSPKCEICVYKKYCKK